ncbi:TonB-dependent receptor plug domain-containing protein [Pseudoalteromonas luteoviolacea]|uniref:Ligand-gated channel n=1 Tax=Pseudoalteromonas luteoviolacea S4054 TaxID=1129367 RepID=A0A0F6AG17_9GAMM|nr:TonB-dependent receptor [Pseudoalteromonas luteoviolacea]AOT09145.1 ligand-gated channel [Pseudoalteromonas luteoviolacea]AOT14058.1 ligand-gated channel [Pseudoalteromonas luteoviolacea]AOT18973.1 ligand-gated channel [Pseudoalteromonas luteoviolacea]KKE85155.1 ligand-gated channel [Pseudoalteromonas luteoviolacea S4054]KZN70273.1 ligand-gated channel [Pseudoalteromonas luteoviolacea S4047-1]
MLKPSFLAASVSLILASAPAFTFKAHASSSQSPELKPEVIEVTGTRRSLRSIAESTVPVDIISLDEINSSGQLELSQVLATLVPSFNFPNSQLADGTDHARPAVLRGLAPDHTLVLVNGKRRHSSALLNLNGTVGRGSSAVDLNMIPTAAIKRIEVLRDGAAAQYGSDAIAGVINIVLKDADEGGSLNFTYGKYDTQMAGAKQLERVYQGDDGELAFDLGEDRRISDGNTSTLSGNIGLPLGDNGFVHLSAEMRNKAPSNRSGFDPRTQYAKDDAGHFDPREFDAERYNHRFGKADIEDVAFFYNAGYDLSDTLSLYSFGSYSEREGNSGGFFRRPQDGRNVVEIYPNGFLPQITTQVDDFAVAAGITSHTAGWDLDSSINYGRNQFSFGVTNSLNTSMGAQSPTDFDNGDLVYDQLTLNFDAKNSIDLGLYEEVFITVGAEYRNESYQIKAGEEASYLTVLDAQGIPVAAGGAQVMAGFSPASAVDESRHNIAVFTELDTYLTAKWNLVVAARFEDYSDFGSTLTGKLATRYEFNDALSFRGAISTGFRAPSLAQSTYKSVSTVFENGIPNEVGLFPVDTPAAQALGARALDAEESINFTAGFIYTYDAFSFTVDAYRIDIDDRIVLSENLSGDAVEDILKSAGEHNVQRVRYFTNAIDSRTQGVDIVATYSFDLSDLGELSLSAALNLNDTEVTHVKDNPAELEALGDEYQYFARREIARFEDGTPKDKLNLVATWQYHDWTAMLKATRYGETTDSSSTIEKDEVLDAKWITDLEVAYQMTEQWRVAVGANNLFDQYPQDTVGNIGFSNFNQIFPYSAFSAYNTDGRFVYAKVSFDF